MAFVSLFNVITQDTWPLNPTIPHTWLKGRVLLATRSTDKLRMGMGRWARVGENDKRPHRTLDTGLHQSYVDKGQGREVPWATYLILHITDEAPGAQKTKTFPSHIEQD